MIEGVKVILAKPQTYMNLSGESIAEIVNFYKLDPESEMLIIFDDISLAPGNIRVRKKAVQVGIMESRALFQVWEPQTLCELKSVWGKATGMGSGRPCAWPFFRGGPCKGGRSHTGCGRCSSPDDSGGSRQGNE